MAQYKDCEKCHGTGYVDDDEQCQECRGAGVVENDDEIPEVVFD
jgi:DnaJ-class molecular chaperone